MASIRAGLRPPAQVPRQPRRRARFLHQGAGLDPAQRSAATRRRSSGILAEVTLGSGALAVIGGTVGVITAMCFFTGTEVGLQGYAALNQIGTVGVLRLRLAPTSTPARSRPLVAGIALAATVGCGFTAQLGAMRISEEIDALEVMAIPSLPFLVTTRIIGGLIAIVPLYVVGLLVVVLRDPADRDPRSSARAPAPTTTTSTCSCHPATCCGRSARCWSSR